MAVPNRDVVVDPITNNVVGCVSSTESGCISATIIVPNNLAHYDKNLALAANELQAVLDNVKKNAPPNRELSFVNTPNGLLLAWTTPLITRQDGEDEFLRALGIL